MPTFCNAPAVEPIADGADKPALEPSNQRILAAQLARLTEFSIWCQYGWVLLGGLVAGVLSGLRADWQIQGFLGLDLAGVAIFALLAHRFRKIHLNHEKHARWRYLYTLISLILGVIWGAAGLFLFVPDSLAHQAFLALAIVGMAATSAAGLSWHMPAFLAFVLPSVVPMSLRFLAGDSSLQLAIGAMAVVYLVIVVGLGWSLNRRFAEFIARRFENERQIENLLTGRASENAVQARLEMALESMSEGLAVFDADDRLVICNRRFFGEQQAGGAPDITGITFEELVRGDVKRKPAQSDIEKAGIVNAEGREEKYIEERLAYHRNPVGAFEIELVGGRWLQIRDRRTADGGTVIVQTEITAYKRAEEILRAAKERAEWASRSKSEFLANTSHELRTPLNAIIGFSQMMESEMFGELGNPRYRDYAKAVRESGEHLLSVVNDLLDLSKIEAGKLTLSDELIDVSETLFAAWNLAKEQAESAEPTLITDIPDSLPPLRADKRMFTQIALNFLSNAVKFTPAGGRIGITGKIGADGSLVIQFADTGIGMTEEDIERAFEPFGQGSNALIRRHEGTGLGVPLSKSLIELHGGTLSIESEQGSGTTVTVRFPRDRIAVEA